MGFDSKWKFAPPTIFLGLLLCPCMWRISSQLLQHLPSYWGFSDLGHGVSPLCHSLLTQEKAAVTPQETDPDLPMSVQESPEEAWVSGGPLQVGGTECSSTSMESFDEVTITFITSTIVWSQVNSKEGTHLLPSTENWIKDLLSMAPPIRTRPSFPLSQSLPSGSFPKPLILLHQRADRLKTTITGN